MPVHRVKSVVASQPYLLVSTNPTTLTLLTSSDEGGGQMSEKTKFILSTSAYVVLALVFAGISLWG
ncbi:hypothetical protein KIM372_09600 [Bombiscardovia nodaiensis]|uniref:Uncharacterized protein n=1 Tax=Bombiscardovia nodaiensis TaxID=2932181 RepID=A0ABM8B837_9BIFI|nr:hypothetical protein KIM372_09600 [Bombiscardovia nodaiensis]